MHKHEGPLVPNMLATHGRLYTRFQQVEIQLVVANWYHKVVLVEVLMVATMYKYDMRRCRHWQSPLMWSLEGLGLLLSDLVPTILKWELQNQQRHFCTSTTTVHYPRGSSHIVLLQYWNGKPIFGVRISGQSMLPDGCWNYMSKDRSVAKFVTQCHTDNDKNFNL